MLSISDASGNEGGSLLFTVTLSVAQSTNVTVNYATAYGSAGSGDFTAKSGTLTFTPGQKTQTFSVSTINNTTVEPTETFTVNLSSPTGPATIGDGQGIGTIYDDDEFGGSCGGLPC